MFAFVIWAAFATQQARESTEPKYSIPRPVIEVQVETPFDISKQAKPEPTVPVKQPKR